MPPITASVVPKRPSRRDSCPLSLGATADSAGELMPGAATRFELLIGRDFFEPAAATSQARWNLAILASSFSRFVPPFGKPGRRHRGDRALGCGIVRRRIKKRQSRTHRVFKVNDVQGRRALVEIVAITAWIKAKDGT